METKSTRLEYSNTGRWLTLIFIGMIVLIVGGNSLLIWQFREARFQTDHLAAVSQQLIAILRFQESLLLLHQRLDAPVRSRDAHLLVNEIEPLRKTLLEQTQRTRNAVSHLPPGTRVDPTLFPTLEAIEITLPRQLEAITELATLGDWDAVRLRLGTEVRSFEIQSSVLVSDIDQEVNAELTEGVAKMANLERRILIIVPTTAICTFLIATFFGWAITRRMIELRIAERVSERTRITCELHDTFLQTVQASKLVAEDALDSTDPAHLHRAMQQLSVWLEQATQEGRAALNSLRVSTLERNDLAEAIRRAIEECRMQTHMQASFSIVGTSKEMHPIVRDEVYRIGYEAIRNACKHSEGSRLDVGLSYAHDLSLCVSDNGIGLDQDIADKGREGHFGLHGMRERALRIGGRLKVVSSSTSGTSVQLIIPGRIAFLGSKPVWWTLATKLKGLFNGVDRGSNLSC